MSQLLNVIDELSQMASWGSSPPETEPQDSRTSLKRSLRAIVPSAAVVLSMSTLTVIILVLVVMTVAQATPLSQGDSGRSDAPWSRWNASPNLSIGDQETLYADFAPLDEMTPIEQYGAAIGMTPQGPRQ